MRKTSHQTPPTILFVMGTPRSGSTILGSVLGELDGFFHVGEACYLWRGLQSQNRRRGCACGSPNVRECEVWSAILERTVDQPGLVKEAWAGRRPYETIRRGGALVRNRRLSPHDRRFLASYADLMGRLYRSISEVTGARVIVDSSKWPWDAAILGRRELSGARFQLLHLVRDSRAFVYSLQRRRMPQLPSGNLKMRRAQLLRDALRWVRLTRLARSLYEGEEEQSSLVVRYEDFAVDPAGIVNEIAASVDESPSGSPFIGLHEAQLSPQHNWGGNSLVWGAKGTVLVQPDQEWQERMRRSDVAIATAITRAQLRHFGYSLGPERMGSRQYSKEDNARIGDSPC